MTKGTKYPNNYLIIKCFSNYLEYLENPVPISDQVPDERVREMVLEEHLECGCACGGMESNKCLGKFNKTTCECLCSRNEFGQVGLWSQRILAI